MHQYLKYFVFLQKDTDQMPDICYALNSMRKYTFCFWIFLHNLIIEQQTRNVFCYTLMLAQKTWYEYISEYRLLGPTWLSTTIIPTLEVEAGCWPQVWSQPGLCREFKASLNYMARMCVKKGMLISFFLKLEKKWYLYY